MSSGLSSRCGSARALGSLGKSATSSRVNSARLVASLVPRQSTLSRQSSSNELLSFPGSLLLARRGDDGRLASFSGTARSSAVESLASEVSPTCALLGWPSPPQASRLQRVERMMRRRRACNPAPSTHSSGHESPSAASKASEVASVNLQKTVRESPPRASIPEIQSSPLIAFTRLRMGKLADIRNRRSSKPRLSATGVGVSSRRFGNGFDNDIQPVCFGGLFSQEVLSHYDVDKDGRLSAEELGSMLRDQGMCLDYSGAARVLGLIAGSSVKSVGFEEFGNCVMRMVEKRRGSGGEAIEVLRCAFRSYDANKSGLLEVPEYTQLLNHLGRRPHTEEEWAQQGAAVASCRWDTVPGPLNFDEFVVLARKINGGSA